MNKQKINAELIEYWFMSSTGPGMILPDGWFGRPHDNRHSLTKVLYGDNFLHILLDKGFVELKFTGPIDVNEESDNLVIRNFDSLLFSRTSYNSNKKIDDKTYNNGDVIFVSHALRY
jgi:hypothetical protein